MKDSLGTHQGLVVEPARMEGRHVVLEPLSAPLRSAVAEAFASDVKAWNLMVNCGAPEAFASWWERMTDAMRRRESIIFTVRRRSDLEVVGTSGFLLIERQHRRVEIGATFYRPDARGTAVNAECKLMLLNAAFGAGANRVEFLTDALNLRSRAALAKIGATEEGILRRHKVTWTGRIRDSVIFSITSLEWDDRRQELERRLSLAAKGEGKGGP